ncbi:LysR family transcriptional regulator [Pelagibius sp. Alg239-R121]|uniref:LysR family transcriptional regulator n=1 Tax=Pelagibius sp. Alg239-R121 TaxID=2993448 RepID=UPI0024A6E8A7|nr:LysR family transcriptional regulator [Pelagibius sp. Alg239-R121]
MKNWDDIRIFLAVVRGGSGAAGARLMGMDQSTVSRRLKSFEAKLGARVFERGTGGGSSLNAAGQKLYETALRMEQDVIELDRRLAGQDQQLSGTIRISIADSLSNHLLFPVTASFLQRYPGINLRIRTSLKTRYDEISQRGLEADVVLRTSDNPPENLVGRRLATAAFAAYASRAYLESCDGRTERMLWMNLDDGSDGPVWPRLAPEIPDALCRLRVDSVPSLLEAVRQGVGATILPCFMGDADPGLARVPPAEIVSRRDFWLLTHADLRYTARIRAFLDHLNGALVPFRDLVEGRKPQPVM